VLLFLFATCGKSPQETREHPGTSTPKALPQMWTIIPIQTENIERISAPSLEVIAIWETYRDEMYGCEILHPLIKPLFMTRGEKQHLTER
jgi:hypothetical protein